MSEIVLKPSHLYRLIYKLQSGNGRWYKYEATMTFLGHGKRDDNAYFNLRPLAGTQSLPFENLIEAEDLGMTDGRDDSRHRVKKSLGPIPKED